MDRPAAIAMLAAIPLLCVVFFASTRIMPPLLGYLAGLAFYWFAVLVPLLIWRGGFVMHRLRLVWPAGWVIAANAVMIIGVAIAAAFELSANPIPLWVLALAIIAALLNGTLEELFWRGTLLRDDAGRGTQVLQLAFFSFWHVALLFAQGVYVTGGAFGILGGAALGGALWTYARMQTGFVGFGMLSHIGLNIFAFIGLAAQNLG